MRRFCNKCVPEIVTALMILAVVLALCLSPIATDPAFGREGRIAFPNDNPAPSWTAEYDSVISGHNECMKAMTSDGAGNLYVAGVKVKSDGEWDLVTLKYTSDGVMEWIRFFDRGGGSSETARAMELDSKGNICILGATVGDDGDAADYFILEYDSAGCERRVVPLDLSAFDVFPERLLVDGEGTVFIAGAEILNLEDYFWNGASYRYIICRVDSLGQSAMIPAAESDYYYKYSTEPISSVAMKDDYIYITGTDTDSTEGSRQSEDIFAVKLDRDGRRIWKRTFELEDSINCYSGDILIDDSGSVFLGGFVEFNGKSRFEDYFIVVKLDSNGALIWKGLSDFLEWNPSTISLIHDNEGNLYCYGEIYSDWIISKYDPKGEFLWSVRTDTLYSLYQCRIAVNGEDNLIVSGYGNFPGATYDFTILKYGADGRQIWSANLAGKGNNMGQSGGDPEAIALAVDAIGSIYLSGTTKAKGNSEDFLTAKYSSAGEPLWMNYYDTLSTVFHRNCVCLTDDSNRVITYGFHDDGQRNMMMLDRRRANGERQDRMFHWVSCFDRESPICRDIVYAYRSLSRELIVGEAAEYRSDSSTCCVFRRSTPEMNMLFFNYYYDSPDYIKTVPVDGEMGGEALHIAAWGQKTETGDRDYVYLKFAFNIGFGGGYGVAGSYDGPGRGEDIAAGLAVDGGGGVYVAGRSQGATGDYDYAAVKFDPETGEQLWAARYGGGNNRDDCATDIAADDSCRIVVTGYSAGGEGRRVVTVAWDAAGAELWRREYAPQGGGAEGLKLLTDGANGIYVGGTQYGAEGGSDFLLLKYDGGGNLLWARSLDIGAGSRDSLTALALDSAGHVCAAGMTERGGRWDMAAVKCGSGGEPLFMASYDSRYGGDDCVRDMAADREGGLVIAGYSETGDGGSVMMTVKYSLGPVSAVEAGRAGRTFALRGNYPNPFNPLTAFRFSLSESGPVSLKVYDLLGRETATVLEGTLPAGEHKVSWNAGDLPAGVYLYRLEAGVSSLSRKFTLLK